MEFTIKNMNFDELVPQFFHQMGHVVDPLKETLQNSNHNMALSENGIIVPMKMPFQAAAQLQWATAKSQASVPTSKMARYGKLGHLPMEGFFVGKSASRKKPEVSHCHDWLQYWGGIWIWLDYFLTKSHLFSLRTLDRSVPSLVGDILRLSPFVLLDQVRSVGISRVHPLLHFLVPIKFCTVLAVSIPIKS